MSKVVNIDGSEHSTKKQTAKELRAHIKEISEANARLQLTIHVMATELHHMRQEVIDVNVTLDQMRA